MQLHRDWRRFINDAQHLLNYRLGLITFKPKIHAVKIDISATFRAYFYVLAYFTDF